MQIPTPRTDEYVEAWNSVNGDTNPPLEKGPFRHGIDWMRRLERERSYAVALLEKIAHRPGFVGFVGTGFSDEIEDFLAALKQGETP